MTKNLLFFQNIEGLAQKKRKLALASFLFYLKTNQKIFL
jgi:hypothetical protein